MGEQHSCERHYREVVAGPREQDWEQDYRRFAPHPCGAAPAGVHAVTRRSAQRRGRAARPKENTHFAWSRGKV
jgi:hypothetical protein